MAEAQGDAARGVAALQHTVMETIHAPYLAGASQEEAAKWLDDFDKYDRQHAALVRDLPLWDGRRTQRRKAVDCIAQEIKMYLRMHQLRGEHPMADGTADPWQQDEIWLRGIRKMAGRSGPVADANPEELQRAVTSALIMKTEHQGQPINVIDRCQQQVPQLLTMLRSRGQMEKFINPDTCEWKEDMGSMLVKAMLDGIRPEAFKKFVKARADMKGWDAYKSDPARFSALVQELALLWVPVEKELQRVTRSNPRRDRTNNDGTREKRCSSRFFPWSPPIQLFQPQER